MAKSKQQIYCNYIPYLKDNYPDFREFVGRTCSRGFFKPPNGKGINGITILVPDNKATSSKIEDLLYGVSSEEFNEAAAIVRACIIYSYLPTASDFNAQKDDLPSSTLKKIKVEKIDGENVILEGGVKISPDKAFKTNDQGGGKKVAIWLIKAGIPKASTEDTAFSHATLSLRKGSYNGGSDAQVISNINRASYLRTILYAYHMSCVGAKRGQSGYRLPLIEYSASLIGYIMDNHPDHLPDAMSVCNLGLSDIVFLVEPDCSIEPLIPDNIIDGWWDNRKTYPIVETYKKAFKAVSSSASCFSRRDEIVKAFNAYRDNNPADVNAFDKLAGLYKTLSESNALFGISGIFPRRVAERYQAHPALKMIEDDRRCCFENCLMDYETVTHGGENDLSGAANLFCDFGAKKGVLGFGAMIIMNSVKAMNKAVFNAVDSMIAPIYNCNLSLYMPGMSPLPGHVVDPHNAPPRSYVDLNAYNINVINAIYPDQITESIPTLDRMALHCYNVALKGVIHVPTL
jgi:hypothetical protein